MLSRLLLVLLSACVPFLVSACQPAPAASTQTLNVFAASSLADAFTEIGADFEAEHSGVEVVFNFGASQVVLGQIKEGAPADVYASADQKYGDEAVADGLAEAALPFAGNELLLILPADNPAQITSLADLTKPGLKLVLAAAETPVGRYARAVLDNLAAQYGDAYPNQVLANVVSNEQNVRLVLTKVQLGEADAGIVYITDAVAASDLPTLPIPAPYNVAATYTIAPLSDAAAPDLAQDFVDYVLSPAGQATLQKWGFQPAAGAAVSP